MLRGKERRVGLASARNALRFCKVIRNKLSRAKDKTWVSGKGERRQKQSCYLIQESKRDQEQASWRAPNR